MTTWFITGTSTGFGRHLTEQLLAQGEQVAATARRPETLSDLAGRYGEQLWTAELDVTDTKAIHDVVARAFTELGRVDVIVSNAGYGLLGAAEELSDGQIIDEIATNLTGSIQLARAIIPRLRSQGGGKIFQLSSMGGQIGFPGLSLYHATKWGIEGFYESVRPEIAPFGIQTCLVEPGSARTNFGRESMAQAPAMAEYADTPAGAYRRRAASRTTTSIAGDAAKMATAIIEAAAADLPERLLLGSDAYHLVHTALTGRLAALEAQQELASSTDADDYAPAN
jgi:NADP-dependent 3-hydroxy acid dehydrogenase YdfG